MSVHDRRPRRQKMSAVLASDVTLVRAQSGGISRVSRREKVRNRASAQANGRPADAHVRRGIARPLTDLPSFKRVIDRAF